MHNFKNTHFHFLLETVNSEKNKEISPELTHGRYKIATCAILISFRFV